MARRRPARAGRALPLARLGAICLALPDAVRLEHGSHASFRVRNKVFAYYLDDHHGDGIASVCCKTSGGEHQDWVARDPARYYLPAYIGARGWVGLRLDVRPVNWREVEALVRDSYRLTAPKRLLALLLDAAP